MNNDNSSNPSNVTQNNSINNVSRSASFDAANGGGGDVAARQELIDSAVTFLQHPNVRDASLSRKLEFLRRKGLSESEIEHCCRLVGISSAALASATSAGGGAPAAPIGGNDAYRASSEPRGRAGDYMTPYYAPAPVAETSWTRILALAFLFGGIGAAIALVMRKYLAGWLRRRLLPLLDGDTERTEAIVGGQSTVPAATPSTIVSASSTPATTTSVNASSTPLTSTLPLAERAMPPLPAADAADAAVSNNNTSSSDVLLATVDTQARLRGLERDFHMEINRVQDDVRDTRKKIDQLNSSMTELLDVVRASPIGAKSPLVSNSAIVGSEQAHGDIAESQNLSNSVANSSPTPALRLSTPAAAAQLNALEEAGVAVSTYSRAEKRDNTDLQSSPSTTTTFNGVDGGHARIVHPNDEERSGAATATSTSTQTRPQPTPLATPNASLHAQQSSSTSTLSQETRSASAGAAAGGGSATFPPLSNGTATRKRSPWERRK